MKLWTGFAKAAVRTAAVSGKRNCRHALFLPGSNCLCVKQAIQTGLVDPNNTHVTLVERNREVFRLIESQLPELNLKSVDLYHEELHRLKVQSQIDFAFIDLLGTVTRELATWGAEVLSPQLADDAVISVTLNKAWRNNQFMSSKHKEWRDGNRLFETSVRLNIHRDSILVASICALEDMFPRCRSLLSVHEYKDTQPMALFRLSLGDQPVKTKNEKGRLAALKAWETRRKLAHKRRLAALKAWKTRRARTA
jgi:hypothetical protein